MPSGFVSRYSLNFARLFTCISESMVFVISVEMLLVYTLFGSRPEMSSSAMPIMDCIMLE